MEYIIIGIITAMISNIIGFSASMWQHWLIFALGMLSFELGRYYQTKKEKYKMENKCRECPRPIDGRFPN